MFDKLRDLTRSCHTVALDMDAFRAMRLVEKRGDEYMFIDGAPPADAALNVAKGHDVPGAPIPPVHGTDP